MQVVGDIETEGEMGGGLETQDSTTIKAIHSPNVVSCTMNIAPVHGRDHFDIGSTPSPLGLCGTRPSQQESIHMQRNRNTCFVWLFCHRYATILSLLDFED